MDNKRFSKLTLLRASRTRIPDDPNTAVLEVFENLFPERDYEIEFDCPEFTSLCPVTGQPDFGEIKVKYIPNKLCVESKSLKLFLFSFRNFQTFHEESVNMIADKIYDACSPRWLEVCGNFNPRGGISINVRAVKMRKGSGIK